MEIQASQETAFQSSIQMRMLQKVYVSPEPILSIFYHPQSYASKQDPSILNIRRLYVVRSNFCQIHAFSDVQGQKEINSESIHRFDLPAGVIKVYEIDGVIFALSHFQMYTLCLKESVNQITNWNWETHPFTTQVVSSDILNTNQLADNQWVTESQTVSLYTYHQKQAMRWWIDQDKVRYQYLVERDQPFHINALGQLEGQGKKVKPIKKGVKFTCFGTMQSRNSKKTMNSKKKQMVGQKDTIFVGDSEGTLHIYECLYLTKVLSIRKHIAPILSIKVNSEQQKVYWTGSDSKICCLGKAYKDQLSQYFEWQVTSQVRGQSHDILSLQLCGNDILVSGGLTTDLCFYRLDNFELTQEAIQHRVAYTSEQLTSIFEQCSEYYLILFNRFRKLELWKLFANGKLQLEFCYNLSSTSPKIIKQAKISPQKIKQIDQNTGQSFFFNYVILLTTEETVCFKYNSDTGLHRIFAIEHSYQFVDFYDKQTLICLRDSSSQQIQKVDCRNGKIQILMDNVDIGLVTEMKVIIKKEYIINKNFQVNFQSTNLNQQNQTQYANPFHTKNSVKVPKILQLSSKFTNLVLLINLKSRKVLKRINLNEINSSLNKDSQQLNLVPYTMLHVDLTYKNSAFASTLQSISIIAKFFDQAALQIFKVPMKSKQIQNLQKVQKGKKNQQSQPWINYSIDLPVKRGRFAGWLTLSCVTITSIKLKRYFYVISEGKAMIISNVLSQNRKRKIRTKQINRVGTVIGSVIASVSQEDEYFGQALLMLGMNLKQTVGSGRGAVINKKVQN